jgi:acetoacetyl-CoA reductase
MENKIALVTGGMGGIGTAICQLFTKMGATVIACYNRQEDAAKQWQLEQKKLGFDFYICYVDVADFASCEKMVKEIENKFGRIDILINNAGITRDVQFRKMNVQQWHDVVRTNLDSMFNITRNVINGMIERGFGRIINISSINAQKGQFGQTNYAAAKAGIHAFTKSLAQEVAKKGITVNTVSPGYVDTCMVPTSIRDQVIAQIPIGRLGMPDEIARAVAFLAAAENGFITGSNLMINGGQYLM